MLGSSMVSADRTGAQEPEATPAAQPAAPSPPAATADPQDPSTALREKRDEVGRELQDLSQTLKLSEQKATELQQGIAALEKTAGSLREALIESATRRKDLEKAIAASETKLAEYGLREDEIRKSFYERRGTLAEVLAALQRMGRNPPPALLVSPDDALASVRTAILLGAVVPGIRKETDELASDLHDLATLRVSIQSEKTTLLATLQSRQEEERRMDLLLVENDKLSRKSAAQLEEERRHSEELAKKAVTLEGLIGSLETEIASVREAMDAARLEEEKRRQQTEEQRQRARELAETTLPDKNRIAPAYSFGELKAKLELPAAGEILRQFGDPDGTGHPARGMVIASSAGSVVTAPSDATVVYAGEFRSYGQMIILNTGEGYHIVLSGMDRVNTQAGKFVLSGEPIAVMGEKRVASATALALETDRPTLYIEFRKDGKSVDSRPWWVERDSGKVRNDT
ncbi:murein hydrolase activator EnvC [Agrobacterium sp. a22-2]|nr:murein hydrolase activator EnvC [Agrobacterium sp. a22-2]